VYGAAIIIFSQSHWFALSMACLAVLGFSDMISVVIRMTLIQLEATDDMRGRVSAVNSLFVIASNQLGDFRAGLMAAWIGTIPAVLIGGIGAVLVALIGRTVFSALYRVENLDTARR
jgi:predicted MFS family arabinose efflux permease